MRLPIRFSLPLLLGASLAGAGSASPAPRATDMTERLRVSEHRHGDDLLSAGLGLEGLRAMVPPAFADAAHPTAAELRRRAIWSSWRGIADLSPGGGFGTLYGAMGEVPGREYATLARVPGARQPHRVLVQVPDAFDAGKRCVVVAPASGSRGVYGAIAVAGPWALPRGCAVAYTDKGAGSDYVDLDARIGVRLDGTPGRLGEASDLAFAPDVPEGATLRIDEDGTVYRDDTLVAQGMVQTAETIAADQAEARAGMSVQLKAFATNTMEYVEKEQDLIFDGVGVPDVATKFEGRHVLVVVRGYRYKEDLAALRPYIREYKPVIIGVDGGADAILEEGLPLHMIVGDMDSVSDKALKSGAEIIIHAYRDGRAPGKKRVEDLGVPHVVFPCTGTSEDVAMLLADDKGAELIVALGTHNTLIEFLDKGRSGMASTFLTRLALGGKLIDAKGVSQLYRSRISNWQLFFLVLAGAVAIAAALASTATGQALFGLTSAWFSDVIHWFATLF